MSIHRTILAAAFALASFGAAHANELRPVEGRSIDLGEISGVAYYTVERDGFRIVPGRLCVSRPSLPLARAWCFRRRARRVSLPARSRSADRTTGCWSTKRRS
jgi:hypothetical protein